MTANEEEPFRVMLNSVVSEVSNLSNEMKRELSHLAEKLDQTALGLTKTIESQQQLMEQKFEFKLNQTEQKVGFNSDRITRIETLLERFQNNYELRVKEIAARQDAEAASITKRFESVMETWRTAMAQGAVDDERRLEAVLARIDAQYAEIKGENETHRLRDDERFKDVDRELASRLVSVTHELDEYKTFRAQVKVIIAILTIIVLPIAFMILQTRLAR